MKILVVGASQGTGALAVAAALRRGHEVTCFARHPENLKLEQTLADSQKLKRFAGDFHDASSVANAVMGQDAVVITASLNSLKGFKEKPHYFSKGTSIVIEAMKKMGVRRLVVLSAFGVGESRKAAHFFAEKVLISFILKIPFQDHERQEKLVMQSGLDWVIARPTRLTNGPAKHKYTAKTVIEAVPNSISRADVAEFLVDGAEKEQWVKQAVQLGG